MMVVGRTIPTYTWGMPTVRMKEWELRDTRLGIRRRDLQKKCWRDPDDSWTMPSGVRRLAFICH